MVVLDVLLASEALEAMPLPLRWMRPVVAKPEPEPDGVRFLAGQGATIFIFNVRSLLLIFSSKKKMFTPK